MFRLRQPVNQMLHALPMSQSNLQQVRRTFQARTERRRKQGRGHELQMRLGVPIDEAKKRIRAVVPPLGKDLIDVGLLEAMQDRSTYSHFDWFSPMKQKLNGDRRAVHELSLSFTFIAKMTELLHTTCPRCLFLKHRCICPYVSSEKSGETKGRATKLWLMQTLGEYGRNNNSGSVLCVVAGATRVMRGWRQQEDELLARIDSRPPGSVVVLFPTDDACTLEDFVAQRARSDGKEDWNQAHGDDDDDEEKEGVVDVVVLDGTPSEASNMERFLPASVPRVSLNRVKRQSWLNAIREQPGPERVCTAQAAAMALETLGDVKAAREIERVVKLALRINTDDRARYLPKKPLD